MRTLALLLAPAAVALLTACPCGETSSPRPTSLAQLTTVTLSAEFLPAKDRTFQTVVRVAGTARDCYDLQPSASAEVGGVALARPETTSSSASCACRAPTFMGMGTMPAAPEGTFVVRDETAELSATVPDLFVVPTVALEDQAGAPIGALVRSSRVYLAFTPANFTDMAELWLAFTPTGAQAPAFTKTGAIGGGIEKDGTRWFFEVPANAAAGEGVLAVQTLAILTTSSCTNTAPGADPLTCNVMAPATREVATAVQ